MTAIEEASSVLGTAPACRVLGVPRATVYRHRQQGVPAQVVVIVEVLVAESQPVDALGHQLVDAVLHQRRGPVIREAGGKLLGDPGAAVDGSETPAAGAGGDGATIKTATTWRRPRG
jgi:hypothetical protein